MINRTKLKLFELDTIWELKPNENNPEAIFCEMFGRAEIVGNIPRFVKSKENYSSNFGFQWLKFAKTHLDSSSGIPLTRDRFFNDTQWTRDELKGKRVLEVGSGAGRFTEILLSTGARVYSFDYSAAVEANFANHSHYENLLLFQGSVYEIPFPDDFFDFVFCFGVLQHTPDPPLALQSMVNKMKPEGKIAVDNYPKGSSKKQNAQTAITVKLPEDSHFCQPQIYSALFGFTTRFGFPSTPLYEPNFLPPYILKYYII